MKSLLYSISKWLSILAVLSVNICLGQKNDLPAKLKKELVKITNGTYVSNDYSFVRFSNGTGMQIETSASCPIEVMSRDNFISIYTSISLMVTLSSFVEAGIGMPSEIKELDEPIGQPDITYNIIMTKNGMQIQVLSQGKRENITMRWEEIFND